MRLTLLVFALVTPAAAAADEPLPEYLEDRGSGVATSMFGTYARPGELLVYPFIEYYRDSDLEYEPADFGMGPTTEYRGRYRASEELLFLGYGINDWLAVELEAGIIQAELEKSPDDTSMLPARLVEAGLSDVEGQLRARLLREHERRPEIFSYFETVFPTGERHSLIGTSAWEFKLGFGVAKGFRWGTVSARTSAAYDDGEEVLEIGEYALEYLKRIGNVRLFAMIEGEQDEVAFVPEVQFHLSRYFFVKAGCGLGITSKATDVAPEVGMMFTIPVR